MEGWFPLGIIIRISYTFNHNNIGVILREKMDKKLKEIINNWITKQEGFFITPSHLKCIICKKDVANKIITKRNGICLPCLIYQILSARMRLYKYKK